MADFRLDRFSPQDEPSARKRRLRQVDCEKIEGAFDALQGQVADIAALLAQVVAAQAAADAAQADADAAARETARINSYPSPGSVLGATDAGTSATITIAAHTRVYPVQGSVDIADVAIAAGSVTGLAYSTRYFIYYDDTTLALTTPTFLATTTSATAQVGAAAGRHFVGYISTPASGGTGTVGTGGGPPGGGGGEPGGAIP
jgi:hypothetical protein